MTSRWSPRRALLAVAFLLHSAAALLGQSSSVQVRSPSAKLLDVTPGHTVTASVVVANRAGEFDEFTERLTLPPGCQKIAPADGPFRIEAGGQTVRVIAVLVPARMPAGAFPMHYEATSRRDPGSGAQADFTLSVRPVDDLEFVVDEHADTVIAGSEYTVHTRVANHGNGRLAVQVKARSSLGFPVEISSMVFPLEAGASHEIVARVKTDAKLPLKGSHAVTFELTATTAAGKTLSASQASVADVIPLVTGNRDPYHYLPMRLDATTLFTPERGAQFQTSLSGAGTLDEEGVRRVDFRFRGPDTQNASLFGEHDEYGVSYHDEHWDVDLGDRIYELSPLTEHHAFGRGAAVAYRGARTSAGVFYMTTRFRRENTEEIGAFIREDLNAKWSVQGNFLRKQGGDFSLRGGLPQNLFTVETRYHGGKALDLRLEAGGSRSDSGLTDHAYRIEARGELFGKLDYVFQHTNAGPDFHGYDNDTNATELTLALPIGKRWRAHFSYDRYGGHLETNPEFSSVVNREDSWSTGVDFTPNKKTTLNVEWKHLKRTDILEPAAYDYGEDSLRLGAGHNFGKVNLQSFLEIGTLENQLSGDSGSFQRYNVFASYQPTSRQSYSVYATYGPGVFSGSSDRSLTAGLSAHWQLRDRLSASVSYAHNQFDDREGSEQDQAMAIVRYQTKAKDEWALTGRWTSAGASTRGNDSGVMLTFSHPIGLPVSRKTSIGALRGRVTADGTGLGKVILRVGEAYAVTDSAGEFEFPALRPGSAELQVIADSLGPKYVMATALPLKVKIRSAETTFAALNATAASSIAVHCTIFAQTTSGGPKPGAGWNAGVVELTNGRERVMAQTDRQGIATFERLTGGDWKVIVHEENLPPLHYLDQTVFPIVLAPGAKERVEVRVLPRKRTLKMIDGGSIR